MKLLLKALKIIKKDFEENKESIQGGEPSQFINPRGGICCAVGHTLGGHCTSLSTLHSYFKTWKYFSGDVYFPVGIGEEDYFCNKNLWIGYIGELRLSLLDHMISEVEKDLKNG